MQLKNQSARQIALALTQASALLLAGHAHAAESSLDNTAQLNNSADLNAAASYNNTDATERSDHGWLVDSAVLLYKEADSRVQAIEPSVRVQKDFGDQRVLNARLTVDSLTGASPYGATSANVPQTFTGPSGGSTKVTPAGQLPLDDSFKDTRVAGSVNWQQPISPDSKITVGGNLSNEYDFKSAGANASIARDFNDKNTTLSAGVSYEYDQIDAVGGAPVPLTPKLDGEKQSGNKNKNVADVLLGLTQIINRHSLMQLNYSLSRSNGYQNDPYKVITLVDANGNLIADQDFAPGNDFYLYENRPEQRTRHSFYGEYKYGFDRGDVADVSYRYTTDDWGIHSHTLDAKYRYAFNSTYFIEPHVRYYTQTAADFYHSYLKVGDGIELDQDGEPVPTLQYASADSRLGAFNATTYGVKLGMNLPHNRELSLRLEQYQQTPKDLKPIGGNLAGQILQPDLSATFVQLGYSFKW